MRIAIDAMGGDDAPLEIVRGAVEASRKLDSITSILLVGDKHAIGAELSRNRAQESDRLKIVHASEVVEMHDPPAQAVRRKRDSSINRAVELVKNGEADAVVSAGNTGAMVAAATLKLRTLKGVVRPAIATVLPTRGRPLLLLDAGANTDCKAELLRQFGVMGSIYSQAVLHQQEPVVGLLSIGGEDVKGNDTTKRAFSLLNESQINFRGNVEGHDLFLGETDVAVCDGFVGNVVLKTTESVGHAISHWMKEEFLKHPVRKLGALLLQGALRTMKHRMDPETYGGAPLLGVNGICIISHGSSSHHAIFNAIKVASESVHHHINESITEHLLGLGKAS